MQVRGGPRIAWFWREATRALHGNSVGEPQIVATPTDPQLPASMQHEKNAKTRCLTTYQSALSPANDPDSR